MSSSEPNPTAPTGGAANDSQTLAPEEFSLVGLVPDDVDVAELSRRAERLGNVVVIGMVACLTIGPLVYFVFVHGI